MDPNSQPNTTPQPVAPTPVAPTPVADPDPSQKTPVSMTVLTIFLLLFFFPLGLIMMWFGTKWPKAAKFIITGIGIILTIIAGIFMMVALTVYRGLQENARNAPVTVNKLPNLIPEDKSLSGLQAGARNTSRKSDIDSLAEVMELNYGKKQAGMYSPPQAEWFAVRKVPQDPNGGDYEGIPATESAKFRICANLEKVTPNQYCKESLN